MKYPANNSSGVGEQVNYTYLPQMLLDTVSGTSPYVYNTDYDAAGRVTLRELGASSLIDNHYAYYDWTAVIGQGRLSTIISHKSTPDLQNLAYTYDANGNVLTIKDWLDKTGNNPQTQTFTYDALDRLTSAKAEYGTNGTYTLQSYTYNSTTGNLASKAGANYTYGDNNHKHAVTSASGYEYSYDANGNQTQRIIPSISGVYFSYDAENRLVGVSGDVTATFTYDGDGYRVKGAITGGATTTYVGNYFEWVSSTSNMKKYYYAGATRVAMRTGPSTLNYLLGDHLGSQAITTNSSGVRIAEIRYYPWGTTRYTYGTSPTTYQYTGQRVEDYIKLYWIGSRWYDPELGRWIQPDVIVPEAVQGVQAWDRYAYVNNSPVNFNDPSGHCLILCTAIIGGAVGAIVGAVGYTAYTVATGREFNTGHMLLAAGGGATAGALIGTGVGIAAGMSTAAATTAAVTGAGAATTATTTVLNATGGDPTDEINAASQAFGNLSQATNYGIQQGSQLKNAISGTGLQVHHLIEQRLAPALGQSAAQAREWLSAAVTPQEHQVFMNAWRSAVGYINSNNPINTVTATTNDIWTAAQRIYADYPALLDAARKTILGE